MGLMLVAYRSHPDETKAMRDAFKAYDVDQNGRVSRAEFQEVLKKQGYTDEEVGRRVGGERMFWFIVRSLRQVTVHPLSVKMSKSNTQPSHRSVSRSYSCRGCCAIVCDTFVRDKTCLRS